jgi:hypothetical protein
MQPSKPEALHASDTVALFAPFDDNDIDTERDVDEESENDWINVFNLQAGSGKDEDFDIQVI